MRRNRVDRICEYCGQEFETIPARIQQGKAKYCSKACSNYGRRRGKEKSCLHCGARFYAKKALIDDGRGKYCSKKCCVEAQSGEKFSQKMTRIARQRAKSKSYRLKLSRAMKAAHRRGCYKDAHSEEAKAKRAASMRKVWAAGTMDGRAHSPSSIEVEISAALDFCGIEHQTQYRPDGYTRVYDEFVPPNILIEINGDWWHSEKANPGVTKRDKQKARWALSNGFTLITFWEHEIRQRGGWSLIAEKVMPLI